MVKHFKLSPAQIEDLDRWWIAHVYFAPRNKHGDLKPSGFPGEGETAADQSPRAQFVAWARSFAWPEWYIELRWQQHREMSMKMAKPKPRKESARKPPQKGISHG